MQYKIFFLALLTGVSAALHAQESGSIGTYTPYSLYGLGDFVPAGTAAAMGMGGVHTGIRSPRSIDMTNPAGASARDSLTFVIDFGGDMRNVYAHSAAAKSSFNSANFHHIAFAFPLMGTRAGVNFGFMPYTRVGYDIEKHETRPDFILEKGDVRYQYKGEDGLSVIFLNAGFNILPQWAVGIGARYYFGKISRYYNTIFRTNYYFFDTYSQQSLTASGFAYTFGTQYAQDLGGGRRLTLGVSLTPRITIGATERTFITSHSYSTAASAYTDTSRSQNQDAAFAMPTIISAGASISQGDKWTAGIDFGWADWSRTAIAGRREMSKAYDIKLGAAYTPNRYDVRYYSRRITYRAGLRYSQTPLLYAGQGIADKAASIGLGLPFKGVGELNFAAEYGQRGSTNNGGIKENYVSFTLSLTLFELWFLKYKYE